MTLNGFDAARLKIERAQQHILDFDRKLGEFFKTSGYDITIETNVETPENTVKVTAHQSLPPNFALVVGDALHNLRSALDIAWYQVAGADSPSPSKEVFPIYFSFEQLEAHIKGRKEKKPHPSLIRIADTLTKVIQPYKGGKGNDLFTLHKLDNCDKHRLLIPQVQVATLYGLFVEDDKGERYGIKSRKMSELKPLILRKPGAQNLKVIKEGECHATVVFGIGTAAKDRIISTAFREFKIAVTRTIETLEVFYAMDTKAHPPNKT